MTFGDKMKMLRKEKGLSQRDLGERIGITQQTVAQYEKLTYTPKYDTVRKIARALDCPTGALMENEEGVPSDDIIDSLFFGGVITRVSDNMMHLSLEAMNKVEEYTKDLLDAPKNRYEWRTKVEPDNPDEPAQKEGGKTPDTPK